MAQNEVTERIRAWESDGWSASKTAGGHWRLTHPDIATPVFAPSTPSDWRSILNVEATMRRLLRPLCPDIPEPATNAVESKKKIKPRPREKITTFELYTIRPVPSLGRREPPEVVETDEELNRSQNLMAWCFAFMRARAAGHDPSVIRVLRNRFRTDKEYRDTILHNFLSSAPDEYQKLRESRRGAGRDHKRMPVILSTVPCQSPNSRAVSTPTEIRLEQLLDETKKQLEIERGKITALERQIAENAASYQRDLTDMRTARNHAIAVRDDTERLLSDERLKAKTMSSEITAAITTLSQRLTELERTLDYRLTGIEQALKAQPVQDIPVPKEDQPVDITLLSKKGSRPPSVSVPDTIGERIRQARRLRGLSQVTLGEHLKVSGANVSIWETGRGPVLEYYLKDLSEALGVSEDYLVNGTTDA